tara:strand:- start:2131 stop:2295 length:165 start_codon:yes stop_codon:yes gene_type:complete
VLLHNKGEEMAKKYYKVERFIKLQYVDEKDKRIDDTWIECDKDGNPLSKNKKDK